jgi:uncharacterized protein YggE
MPVSKKHEKDHDMRSFFHGGEFIHRIYLTLVGILLVYLIFWVGTMIRNNIEAYYHIGQADRQERMITLEAEAKVTATPDIAMTTIGMVATGETVTGAQEANTNVMNALIIKLKEQGIAEDDIQTTNYNIYPQYNYTTDDGRILEGYEVSQNVTVKIRDIEKANQVIALAGEVGANSVGGLQFTIDDRDVYKQEATMKALDKVYEKARALSKALGVKVVGVVSYNEYEAGDGSYQPYYGYDAASSVMKEVPAPDIQSGSMDVTMHTSVTFEIR